MPLLSLWIFIWTFNIIFTVGEATSEKSVNDVLSFKANKVDNTSNKESTIATSSAGGISFAPKVLDNNQSFGFGFMTINQDENKLASETGKNLQPQKTSAILTGTNEL